MQHFEKELVFEVDLDEERKVPAKEGRPPNRHRVIIRKTNKVNLSTLKFYLERRANFDNSVLEAISKTSLSLYAAWILTIMKTFSIIFSARRRPRLTLP